MRVASALLAAALAACAPSEVPPRPGPQLAVDEADVDAGAVAAGRPLTHVFRLRNHGGRTLRLASLRAAADCTTALAPGEVLAPGAAATLELSCDTGGRIGPLRRTVTVHSNDAARPTVVLALHADIAADIAALEPEFYFGSVRPGERTSRDIRLRLDRPEAVPLRVGSESGALHATLERNGDGEWRIALVVAADAPEGVLRERVVVDTASSRQPQLVIPVLGRVGGRNP